jgi:two-component system cell cycle response regulator
METKQDLSIIIVDDVELTRVMIESTLKSTGYSDIRLANGADDALKLIKERIADVVLADWIMPEMDGLELCNQIRQLDEESNHYTSLILITSKEGIEPLVEAFERGVDDYLNKPIDKQELAARVQAAGRIAVLQNTLLETTQALEQNNQKLQEMATSDPLTGLGNRRYIQQQLEAVIAETNSRGGTTACLVIDLDHFKDINDNYGHAIGDEVLTGIARRLKRAVRPTDIVGRMGGDEFCVVMHFTDGSHCTPAIFERLLKAINLRHYPTDAGEMIVTSSIGVCIYKKNGSAGTLDEILKLADEKLYAAKAAGRNCFKF